MYHFEERRRTPVVSIIMLCAMLAVVFGSGVWVGHWLAMPIPHPPPILTREILPIGTCLKTVLPREAWREPDLINRIEEVGDFSYRTSYYDKGRWRPSILDLSMHDIENGWVVPTPCP